MFREMPFAWVKRERTGFLRARFFLFIYATKETLINKKECVKDACAECAVNKSGL